MIEIKNQKFCNRGRSLQAVTDSSGTNNEKFSTTI